MFIELSPDKSNLREKAFIFSYQFKAQSIIARQSRHQKLEADDHRTSTSRKQRGINAF